MPVVNRLLLNVILRSCLEALSLVKPFQKLKPPTEKLSQKVIGVIE